MKLTAERPFAHPEPPPASWSSSPPGFEPVQDGRIQIEKINAPFLYAVKASGEEFGAGIKTAVEQGWLELHESGTYVPALGRGNRGSIKNERHVLNVLQRQIGDAPL